MPDLMRAVMSPEAATVAFVAGGLFFIAAERWWPRVPRRVFRQAWWTDLWLTITNGLVVQALAEGILGMGSAWLLDRMSLVAFPGLGGVSLWIQLPLFLAVGDLLFYWEHWAFHTWRPLWALHKVHHSAEELDWLSSSRSHSADFFVTAFSTPMVLAPLGFSPECFAIAALFDILNGMWTHSNVAVRLPWLRRILVTPELHRWHHADREEAYRCNLAMVFPFWDLLFGTYYYRPEAPEPLGVQEPRRLWWRGFFGLQVAPVLDGLAALGITARGRGTDTPMAAGSKP